MFVAFQNCFSTLCRLILLWRGSVYKLVYPDLFVYIILYFACSFIYRFTLTDYQRTNFERVSIFFSNFSDLIPVSFVLGFYVSIVIQRWWAQYESLPWPDSLSLFISTSIHGYDDRARLMRRTIVRYINLSFTLTLIMVSPRVKKRFPTMDHLIEAGFMTPNEKKIFEDIGEKSSHPKYWLPLVWAGSIVARCRKEGRIRDDFAVKTMIDEINNLRGKCGGVLSYDWISIPLVYTQVVTLAVYLFFLSTIMGRQFLDPAKNYPKHDIDFFVPIFTFMQFFFYMGWLKVAESLVNPFGEDDDDFEVNWLIDRNLQVSYLIVDEMHAEHPELIQDIYWDEVFPQELPYTIASEQYRRDPPQGSTFDMEIPEADQEFLPMVEEEDQEDQEAPVRSGLNSSQSMQLIKKYCNYVFIIIRVTDPWPFSFGPCSLLGLLIQKGRGGGEGTLMGRAGDRMGSTNSIRGLAHRRRSLIRSASRMSSASHRRMSRNQTNQSLQDSDVFHMSNLTLDSMGSGMKGNINRQSSQVTHDEDGSILIKIKRRDIEGKFITKPNSKLEHISSFNLLSQRVRYQNLPRHRAGCSVARKSYTRPVKECRAQAAGSRRCRSGDAQGVAGPGTRSNGYRGELSLGQPSQTQSRMQRRAQELHTAGQGMSGPSSRFTASNGYRASSELRFVKRRTSARG
ncbi:unnamed protein product, partial [Meganyctiphanes norvegica]